jgi:membrane associated rhomboid family serine protease
MEFNTQLHRSLVILSQRGLPRHRYEPPLFRLLWKIGIQVPPPHYMGFAKVAVSFGAWFAVFWGSLMWLLMWSRQGRSLADDALAATVAGACFGLLMAWFYERDRRKFSLPAWESFGRG